MSNHRKAAVLGMPFGTATGKLRKALLFRMAGQLGLLHCHQCGVQIERIDQFSIEHKEPWFNAADPVLAFFDLDNIAFSHVTCNVSAAKRPNRKYSSEQDRKRASFARYYERSADTFLAKKRERYHLERARSLRDKVAAQTIPR